MFKLTRKHRQGFTIVELIVASGISAMLMYSIYMIFDQSTKLVNSLEGELEVRQNARSVFAMMELDLASAFLDGRGNYFSVSKDSLKVLNTNPSEEVRQWGGNKEIAFTEAAYSAQISGSGNNKDGTIYRALSFDEKTTSPATQSQKDNDVLAEGVTDFRLSYWDPTYSDSDGDHWNPGTLTINGDPDEKLPAAVRVLLELKDSRNTVQRTFFDIIPVGRGR